VSTRLRRALFALLLLGAAGCAGSRAEPPAPEAASPLVVVGMGWARNSVNATSFRKNSVTSRGDRQVVAYYDAEGRVVLAERGLGTRRFRLHPTGLRGDVEDAHGGISIALDGEGRLHLAWGLHGRPLRYVQGVAPGSLELGPEQAMTGEREARVTYPEFYDLPDGGLLFLYRDGRAAAGDVLLDRYDLATRRWSAVQHPLIAGEGRRSPYTNQIAVDARGHWHLSWCWREARGAGSNRDLLYAVSDDEGRSWRRSDGTPYRLPITAPQAEVIRALPVGSDLINQTAMAVDASGRPLVASYWRPAGAAAPEYQLVWRDGAAWRASSLGRRRLDFALGGGGTRRLPMARPKLLAGADGRVHLVFRDAERGDLVSLATSPGPPYEDWAVRDLTRGSVGQWEPSYDDALWRRAGVLHLFVQRVGQGDAEALEELPPQAVGILEWDPRSAAVGPGSW